MSVGELSSDARFPQQQMLQPLAAARQTIKLRVPNCRMVMVDAVFELRLAASCTSRLYLLCFICKLDQNPPLMPLIPLTPLLLLKKIRLCVVDVPRAIKPAIRSKGAMILPSLVSNATSLSSDTNSRSPGSN